MCQIWHGGISQGRVAQSGWSNWITLTMVWYVFMLPSRAGLTGHSLPYLLRFRQCLQDYYHSSSPRPLANALKYFTAFPVILLSAAQKSVVNEIALAKGITVQQLGDTGERWFGEHRLFRIWLLGVVINSMYSFYWDVKMDWGLALCEVDTWLGQSRARGEHDISTLGSPSGGHQIPLVGGRRTPDHTFWGRARSIMTRSQMLSHQRSPCPTPTAIPNHPVLLSDLSASRFTNRFLAFGLRPTLLLPDPLVYHLFALIDLVLRFTWSLKLSSHLHTISEIESGVFMMEALELIRRWMWVFVRIEWEAVKKGELQRFGGGEGRDQVLWDDGNKDEGNDAII